MSPSRARIVGLLTVLSASSACAAEQAAPDGPATGGAAYETPAGAPTFCVLLAKSRYLADLPTAVGTLAAGAGTVEAHLQLTGAVGELRAVLDDVRAEGGYAGLEAAIDDLVGSLTAATTGPFTDAGGARISSGLDALGVSVQPVCTFPTL